jgi:Mrp family chromosome partitioning ATPase
MVDLTSEMTQLWASLGPSPSGRARVVQFAAARPGEGTSTVAREFARVAVGRAAKPVWLIDLDLNGPGQAAAIANDRAHFGPLGKPAAATPDGSMFFTVQPPARDRTGRPVPDARYLTALPVGGRKLWVTSFRNDALRAGQRAHLLPKGDYWRALRPHADLVVIDAPSAKTSNAALVVAPFVDFTVLVVAAEEPDTQAPAQFRDAIEQAGGRCAGIVFNRARIQTPAFVRRMMP